MKYSKILLLTALTAGAVQLHAASIKVTPDNFVRAETDLYLKALGSKSNGFGNFNHTRLPSPIDEQSVIRLNRDTLYSAGVFDLKAGPVTITLPDAGKRFMSMQVINQDHYTPMVNYKAGSYTLSEKNVGTRYVTVAIRTFVDPASEKDLKEAQKLQAMPFRRAITKKEQADMGKLKKSVRGLVVVHPMTELGREMGLKEMTGFCKTAF